MNAVTTRGRSPRLRVYLGDLTHDSLLLSSDTIPINIGFVGAYATAVYGDDVAISLFKYPNVLIDAIRAHPPDVLALSNYSWNSNLAEHVNGLAKQANPHVVTVQGGPNFPERSHLQTAFLQTRPNTDVFIEFEGERAFAELLAHVLAAREGGQKLFDADVPGCVAIVPETRGDRDPVLRKGPRPDRLKNLDDIPSPYLSGMLETFFDGRLVPFLETNRGCPFACTFCHTGNNYFNKINTFSIERLKEEIAYIGRRIAGSGITHLYLADTNFGMYPRDEAICQALAEAQQTYGWPFHMYATTGKNNKERVIEITKVLGTALSVHMSVQSMDPTVLQNIKRSNIRLSDYMHINKTLTDRGQFTRGEVIIGLPGETRGSFTRGLEQLVDSGVSFITSYSLILLHGTPFKDPEYAGRYGIVGKHRLVPLNFGEYAGTRIFDIEETGVANDAMSFDDYLWLRGLSLMVEVLYNSRPFAEFFRYAGEHGVKPFQFVMNAYDALPRAPASVRSVVGGFMAETRGELWESEAELVAHYRDDAHYQTLLAGRAGGNVINRYKAASLVFSVEGWLDFLATLCAETAGRARNADDDVTRMRIDREVATLREFVANKLAGVLTTPPDDGIRRMRSPFDVHAWMHGAAPAPLATFAADPPVDYEFSFTPEQVAVQRDMLQRYGGDMNGLGKIVTRVSSIEALFRHCRKAA